MWSSFCLWELKPMFALRWNFTKTKFIFLLKTSDASDGLQKSKKFKWWVQTCLLMWSYIPSWTFQNIIELLWRLFHWGKNILIFFCHINALPVLQIFIKDASLCLWKILVVGFLLENRILSDLQITHHAFFQKEVRFCGFHAKISLKK